MRVRCTWWSTTATPAPCCRRSSPTKRCSRPLVSPYIAVIVCSYLYTEQYQRNRWFHLLDSIRRRQRRSSSLSSRS